MKISPMSIVMLTLLLCGLSSSARAQVETDTIAGQAQSRIRGLNGNSRYTQQVMSYADRKNAELKRLHEWVDNLDPKSEHLYAWQDHYRRQREAFYAERAKQEDAIIKFRELGNSTSRFLRDNAGVLRGTGHYAALQQALTNANIVLRRHDNEWDGRDVRPPGLTQRRFGAPPVPEGVPAVGIRYIQVPPEVVDVGVDYTVTAAFQNNTDHRIRVRAQLVPAGGASVNPAREQLFWISPRGESGQYTWTVRVSNTGSYEVTMTREVVEYR